MKAIISFFKLIRLPNLILVFASVLFLDYALFEQFFDEKTSILALAICLTASAGYIINDYYDVKIDVINKPNKVIIDRGISRKSAIILHLLITIISLALSFLLNIKVTLLLSFSTLLLWWYSNTLKRLPAWGNLSIGILSSLTIISLYLIHPKQSVEIIFFSSLIFICTLAREIVKDMEDIEGDKSHGCNTLPIILGIRKTKSIVIIFLVSLISFSLYFTYYYLPLLLLFYLLIITPYSIFCIKLTLKSDKISDYKKISYHLKWIIGLGIISILFL